MLTYAPVFFLHDFISFPILRLENAVLTRPQTPGRFGVLRSLFAGWRPGTLITILVFLAALLMALYVSAAVMLMRIENLHTVYVNHPLVSPERFTHDRLLHYLNTNLDQIIKVRRPIYHSFVRLVDRSSTDRFKR